MSKGQSSGSRPAGSRARSVGAAGGGGNPNGAILDDDKEIQTEQKLRFKAWKEGYRKKSLTAKKLPLLDYKM